MACPTAPTVPREPQSPRRDRWPPRGPVLVRWAKHPRSWCAHRPADPHQNPHPLSQVYSFVPIPGAQQHKRPRRRYEEIERMYKCGWQGCEKAYGTLNHLNAHVTMQSHGNKRTPEGKCFNFLSRVWKAVAKTRFRLDWGFFFSCASVSRVTQREPCAWRGHYLAASSPTHASPRLRLGIREFRSRP
jgi:hypothetical protein